MSSDGWNNMGRGTDAITLTGLRVHANHGVYDFEREAGQEFVVDVTVWLDLGVVSASDDVATTVHYGELATEVTDAVRRDPVDLIETVAERVADVVLAHPQAESVRVTVHKPNAPIPVPFQDVAVTIVRQQSARELPARGNSNPAAASGAAAAGPADDDADDAGWLGGV
ncbi:MAG: dihydroneopterin aldolase [Microbacteriaceae bacterium]